MGPFKPFDQSEPPQSIYRCYELPLFGLDLMLNDESQVTKTAQQRIFTTTTEPVKHESKQLKVWRQS